MFKGPKKAKKAVDWDDDYDDMEVEYEDDHDWEDYKDWEEEDYDIEDLIY